MDTILLCSNHIPLVTSIHNTFIEKYMLGANGSYVKVYLYLSKCIQAGEEDLSISSLADKMENTEKDIIRALNYWEKKKLLRITRDEASSVILGIEVLNPDDFNQPSVSVTVNKPEPAKKTVALRNTAESTISASEIIGEPSAPSTEAEAAKDFHLGKTTVSVNSTTASDASPSIHDTAKKTEGSLPKTTSQTAKYIVKVSDEQRATLANDEHFSWMCNVIESYLERPVISAEIELISYLYDSLHFSSDLIIYLYEYCLGLGKKNYTYVQSVAFAWDEKGIKTPEEAKEASNSYSARYTAICKALALDRPLAAIEKKMVESWQEDFKMDLGVILEACNRTVLKLQRADFLYAGKIIERWQKAGIHTLMDIKKADEAYTLKKNAAKKQTADAPSKAKPGNASYLQHGLSKNDADALEKKLLNL